MAVHAICPSIRCQKILTLNDDVRGTVVTCRYCNMVFRVPRTRAAAAAATGGASTTGTSTSSAMKFHGYSR